MDHAIPFSLWRNNDLWNLFPADPGANIRKRDRLPSRNLVEAARKRIYENWELLFEKYRGRFLKEAEEFSGNSFSCGFASAARYELFSVFKESIELTALRRGSPRWEG